MSDSLNNKQRPTPGRRDQIPFIVGSVLALIFIVLAAGVWSGCLTDFDGSIISAVRAFRTPETTKIMTLITRLGNTSFTFSTALTVTLVCICYKGDSRYITLTLLALVGAPVFNSLLKNIFARSRPTADVLISVTGFSFPSGHAMIASAFYGMLAYCLWHILQTRPAKYLAAALLGLLILAIGISRVYLGVHYPSDVLAGFAAGGLWLIVCIALSEKMNLKV